ncbi:MAG: NAD-dependent epimerase/dehydratase family protein [Robiginitomaculum sp.]
MKYLVTGSAGFIGNQLALTLLGAGHSVVGIDCLTDYYDVNLKEARLKRLTAFDTFTEARIDLANDDAVEAIFKTHHPKIVINLAAQAGVRHSLDYPRDYVKSNLVGFLNVLENCRNYPVEHLLYASTSSVYGANTKQPFSEHHIADHPLTIYSASKRANELMAHSYAYLYGIPCTGLRFFTVYGPWMRPDMALYKFANLIVQDKSIDIYNNGKMERDFTYIDDIVDGIIRLCPLAPQKDKSWDSENPDPSKSGVAPFKVYNIGNGKVEPLMRYIELLEENLGKKAIRNMLPMQSGDVHSTFADTSELQKTTGFKPDTNIEVGVKNFVTWFKDYHSL